MFLKLQKWSKLDKSFPAAAARTCFWPGSPPSSSHSSAAPASACDNLTTCTTCICQKTKICICHPAMQNLHFTKRLNKDKFAHVPRIISSCLIYATKDWPNLQRTIKHYNNEKVCFYYSDNEVRHWATFQRKLAWSRGAYFNFFDMFPGVGFRGEV